MKKRFLILILGISILICTALHSCAPEPTPQAPSATDANSSYELQIKRLEDALLKLQQSQYSAEAENEKLIKELQNEIAKLKAEASTTTPPETTKPLPTSIFIYSIKDGKSVIDGFTGEDEHVVIPSEIDGFEVYGISSNAFEDYSFKSVIISEGVEHIDWFAFYNCKSLSSITIPASVRRIGHSAFSGCSKSFTIYCPSGSFAQSYAESYGITYVLI